MAKILLVEDTPEDQKMYTTALTHSGYEVEVISDGEKGLHRAKTSHFDLIILDVILPNKNGLQILEELKQIPQSPPVIIFTNLNFDTIYHFAMKNGADACLEKIDTPIPQLLATIAKLIQPQSPV